MYHTLGVLLVCLGAVWSRDTTKAFRSMPAISNSLVNLGKMDISFHFNTKTPDSQGGNAKSEHLMHSVSPFFVPKSEPEIEPCPCSSLKNFKNPFLSSPADLLNKILRSNDLFSSNQEPVISTMCCDSHEHVQEDTVFFEFSPKVQSEAAALHNGVPSFPFMIDNFLPKAPGSNLTPTKPKAIEIFFFPKKKEGLFEFPKLSKKKEFLKKSDIQVVGDKELRNEFKSMKYRPTYSVTPKKEELMDKEKDLLEKEKEIKEILEKEKAEKKLEKEAEKIQQEEAEGNTKSASSVSPPNSL